MPVNSSLNQSRIDLVNGSVKGIKITMRTDGHHGLIADGVAKLVEFGLPAMDAIAAATKTNAGACAAGSGRQGCIPAGESPAVSVARFSHVAIPPFPASIALV